MSGGLAVHTTRGLQAADDETKRQIGRLGGLARALDKASISLAGKKGGERLKNLYGFEFYQRIGKLGGERLRNCMATVSVQT